MADTMMETKRSTSRKGGDHDDTPVYGAPVSASGAGVNHLCVWAGDPAVPPAGGTSPHPSQQEDGLMGGGQATSLTAVTGFSATCACPSALYTVCREYWSVLAIVVIGMPPCAMSTASCCCSDD